MEQQPRKRDAERSRAEILDAAERLFAERGFDAVTMADVGAAAGVSRGTPGYFFGSKADLHATVLRRAGATFRMLGEALRLRDAGGPRDRATVIRDTVEAFVGLIAARRDVVRLLDRDGGATAGTPHADALREALAPLGPEADAAALTVLAMTWYPVAHPEVAAALGVDVSDAGSMRPLVERVVVTLTGPPSGAAAAAGPAPAPPEPPAPATPPARPPVRDELVWLESGKKKKKKKKK